MEFTPQVKNRVKRVQGQVQGILKMMDEEKSCKEVVTQMSTARSALDRSIALIVSSNLEQCIIKKMKKDGRTGDPIQEAVNLLVKSS